MRLLDWKNGQPGLTTEALAARCGVRRLSMHRIMHGERAPKPATARAIVRETGGAVTHDDLNAAYKGRGA